MPYATASAIRNSGTSRTTAFPACSESGVYRGEFENFYVLDLAFGFLLFRYGQLQAALFIFFGPQTLLKPFECRKAVSFLLGIRTGAFLAVPILSANRAKAFAIRPAQVLHRYGQNKRISNVRQNIDLRSAYGIVD
jgi:hypothetical protein